MFCGIIYCSLKSYSPSALRKEQTMKSKVKETITAILFLAIEVFLLIVITYMLVILFMGEQPMSLTFAIFLSVSFIIIISVSTSGIKDMITEINELIRQEEKEQEEQEEEEEE